MTHELFGRGYRFTNTTLSHAADTPMNMSMLCCAVWVPYFEMKGAQFLLSVVCTRASQAMAELMFIGLVQFFLNEKIVG